MKTTKRGSNQYAQMITCIDCGQRLKYEQKKIVKNDESEKPKNR